MARCVRIWWVPIRADMERMARILFDGTRVGFLLDAGHVQKDD
jgi:hypothetical protein